MIEVIVLRFWLLWLALGITITLGIIDCRVAKKRQAEQKEIFPLEDYKWKEL